MTISLKATAALLLWCAATETVCAKEALLPMPVQLNPVTTGAPTGGEPSETTARSAAVARAHAPRRAFFLSPRATAGQPAVPHPVASGAVDVSLQPRSRPLRMRRQIAATPGHRTEQSPEARPVAVSFISPSARPLVDASPETVARPIMQSPIRRPTQTSPGDGASLFADRSTGGLFAPLPPGLRDDRAPLPPGSPTVKLRHLIAQAEAGPAGYDAVVFSARVPPPKPPSRMTIAEIRRWIADTPGQHHAIGRYQVIPSTLEGLVEAMDVPPHAVFSPTLQDRFADALMVQAGYGRYLNGHISRHNFMDGLAGIWAGLPTRSGLSRYDGLAGNRAVITWARFDREMSRIFGG